VFFLYLVEVDQLTYKHRFPLQILIISSCYNLLDVSYCQMAYRNPFVKQTGLFLLSFAKPIELPPSFGNIC